MNKKLILIIFAFVLVGTAVAVVVLIRKGSAPLVEEPIQTATTTGQVSTTVLAPSLPLPPPPDEKTSVKILATTFAESFGSYSNQSDGPILVALFPFMTEKMKKWAQSQAGRIEKSLGDPKIYHGYTTKVVSDEGLSMNTAQNAEIKFKTLRTESIATRINNKNFYQDITIRLEKVGEAWKVDGAFWGIAQ